MLKLFRRREVRILVAPEGERLYAIGDVHGRLDLLDRLLAAIDADDARRGPARRTVVFLGDLIDRGPDSAGVVERVLERIAAGGARLILGNHEEVFAAAARGDSKATRALYRMDGAATMRSYGLTAEEIEGGSFEDLAALLAERVPANHLALLERGEDLIQLGDYVFVHAGIDHRRPLEEQSTRDLRWVRDPFLKHPGNPAFVVVHGHTPVPEAENHAYRIGVDTGAFASGVLTAVGLEGTDRWFLDTRGA